MSLFLKPILLLSTISILNANVGLDYLNSLRTKAGMPAFTEQANLSAAAQNHSAYLETNSITGHYEDSEKEGYTGDYVSDRVKYTGYDASIVSENVSDGTNTVQGSIDGLMSAIYHRFAFLSLDWDQIGIGISNNGKNYTYNMGNSILNNYCGDDNYSSDAGYYHVCADKNKIIAQNDYESVANTIKENSPEIVIWPANNSDNIPPVFYEESPDPLPNHSVSGYPVSVEFNSKNDFNTSLLDVASFTLESADGTPVETIKIMDKENDPNSQFTDNQYTLFPEKRLEWGSRYNAELIYNYDGTNSAKNWCFVTRSLQGITDRYYRINKNINLNVVAGKKYALYLVPHDAHETIYRIRWNYTTNDPEVTFIDNNTVSIELTGNNGRYAEFEFKKYPFTTVYTVKLTIANNDSATLPLKESCDYDGDGILDENDPDDDNDGYTDVDELAAGSNPKNANSKPLDTDGDKISNITDTDDDNDGISDVDEKAHGLNPLDASDAQKDFDHDGFSNAIEISVGSDIRDKSSHPIWAPVMMDNIITFIPSF